MLSCYFRALRLGGVLTSPQAAPSGLQMTPPSLPGMENPGKPGSPDFILILLNGPVGPSPFRQANKVCYKFCFNWLQLKNNDCWLVHLVLLVADLVHAQALVVCIEEVHEDRKCIIQTGKEPSCFLKSHNCKHGITWTRLRVKNCFCCK